MKKLAFIAILLKLSTGIYAQSGHYAQVNGVKIYYEVHGEGEPLVLLHYYEGSHSAWDPWINSLAKEYRLIIPDLRGHGNSINPNETFTHQAAANDIYALMDTLEIDRFKAMGMSSGGMTLLHMATSDSTRITSMVLIGATTYFPEQARKIMSAFHYESEDPEFLKYLLSVHSGGEAQVRKLKKEFRDMAHSYRDMNFTTPYLAQIKCPTLIIHGDRDEYFPIKIPVEAYQAIPNASLWIIPNGGHLPNLNPLWSDNILKVSTLFLAGEL
jgi:pimeloyl-ACP methyl ester carboxylesterase